MYGRTRTCIIGLLLALTTLGAGVSTTTLIQKPGHVTVARGGVIWGNQAEANAGVVWGGIGEANAGVIWGNQIAALAKDGYAIGGRTEGASWS